MPFKPQLLLRASLACVAGWLAAVSVNAEDGRAQPASSAAERVLVLVNGEPVTGRDLEFLALVRGISEERRDAARGALLEQLIDRQLMRQFLAGRRAEPGTRELEAQVAAIHQLIRRGGEEDPEGVLAGLGFDAATLRETLSLPLAWKTHVRRVVTPNRLREYFDERRHQFDGTRIRASQVFRKVSTSEDGPELLAAEDLLDRIREDVVAGRLTFAEAARAHSQAPTAAEGGDLGFFPYRGRMPEAFTRVAFALEPGEVSRPFRTPFGVHLVTVTERKPGDLSLEDVRNRVFNQLAEELWDETVRELREQAVIEWKEPRP